MTESKITHVQCDGLVSSSPHGSPSGSGNYAQNTVIL